MSANVPLAIRIGAIFNNKGLKQAEKGIKGLQSDVKRLAGAAGIGLSTAAVIRFGKNATRAFAENEKSAQRLQTVVKNLGLAFETPIIEASLDRISAKYGYQGEVLREAYQKLLTSTGSLRRSQDLLNLSLDIAAGSGVNLLTVNQDLAAAYVGQTRGLRKYNLGLSQAELKTLKFDDAVAKLTSAFKGAAGNELETYSGKMRVLQEGAENAQEIIGGGLVDALMILSGDTTVEELALSMAELANNTSTALTNLAKFGQGVKDVVGPLATVFEGFINATQPIFDSIVFGDPLTWAKKTQPRANMGGYPSSALGGTLVDPNAAARKAAEAAAVKRAKELAALQKKTLDTQKKSLAATKQQNALVKASQTLDLERIGIAAALKGDISESDQLSLRLQLALLNENDEAATRLSALLTTAVQRQNELNAMLLATPEAPNPFRNWTMPNLGPYASAGGALSLEDLRGRSGALVPTAPLEMPPTTENPFVTPAGAAVLADLTGEGTVYGSPLPPINITVELDGKVVSDAIRDSTLNESLSGSFSEVNRVDRFRPTVR
jgi:hypothetical protein